MGSNGGTNMGNVQVKVHRGKTPGEMLKWHKRWLVVSGDGLELQLFKNDQEYTPKEVIRVSDVVSVMPGGDTDKKGSTLEITMRKDAKGAQGYSLKVRTQDERNHWLRAVREMREGVWRGADHSSRSNLKDAMDRWRHALSDLRGTDVRLVVDDASVYSLPSADVDRAISFLVEGAWFGPLDKLFRQLKSGGSHAHPVSRVVLVVSTATDASPASFDKVTETLLLRLHWTHEGGVPYLRSPDVASLLSLVVTEIWQLNAERTLVHQPSWKEAVGRLCDIVGKSVPVGLDWAPNIHEDTPDVRSYVHKWASAEYLDAVTNTIIQCFDQHLQAPYQELETWVGAITLLFSRDDVISRAPPRVRIHRNTVRNDDTGNGPTKALLNAFNKCRGRVLEKYSPVLCEGPVPDLRAHLLHTLNHIHMAELMRTAERITVGFEKLKLNFVINWDSFLASLAHIEASSGARLRLAKELLTKYPARVQTVSKAVSEAEWGVLCGLMHTVSVAFVREGSEERTFLADGDLVDVCFIGLQDKPDGGHCVVMSFDVKDLGSFCRGLLASGEGAAAKRPQSLLRLARNCRSESSEASHSEGSSGSNEVMTAHPSRVLASQQSFRSLDSSSRHKQQTHTQFADDSTMMSDRDLPNEILAKLRQTPLDDEYPVSAQLLEDTIRALNEAFTKQRRALEPESKQSVIIHAITKLRKIFLVFDPEKTGRIPANGPLKEVIQKFREWPNLGGRKYEEPHKLMVRPDSNEATFADVSRVLMTRLFPEEVRLSLEKKYHCLLLGLEKTGKSMLVNALKSRWHDATRPTIGESNEVVKIGGLLLSISEVGGRGDWKNWSLRSKHLDKIHGVAFCVDGANPSRFEEARSYLKDVLQSRHLKDLPVLFIINNVADMQQAPAVVANVKKSLKLEKYCKSNHIFKPLVTNIVTPGQPPPEVLASLHDGFEWLMTTEKPSKSRHG